MCCASRTLRAARTCIFRSFFFNDTATTEIYTLSLHDALPIWVRHRMRPDPFSSALSRRSEASLRIGRGARGNECQARSEEHTSELQSHLNLVCRLLLEKKNNSMTHSRSDLSPAYPHRRHLYLL